MSDKPEKLSPTGIQGSLVPNPGWWILQLAEPLVPSSERPEKAKGVPQALSTVWEGKRWSSRGVPKESKQVLAKVNSYAVHVREKMQTKEVYEAFAAKLRTKFGIVAPPDFHRKCCGAYFAPVGKGVYCGDPGVYDMTTCIIDVHESLFHNVWYSWYGEMMSADARKSSKEGYILVPRGFPKTIKTVPTDQRGKLFEEIDPGYDSRIATPQWILEDVFGSD